jgi:hypothetical protein
MTGTIPRIPYPAAEATLVPFEGALRDRELAVWEGLAASDEVGASHRSKSLAAGPIEEKDPQ